MARLKPTTKKIKNLDEVNDALIDIAQAEMQLAAIDGQATEEIVAAKERAAKSGEPFRARITDLAAMIGRFAEDNREELFKDRKSLSLTAGQIGFRKSTKISTRKTTLELLKKLGYVQYVRVSEVADKEAMRELSDEQLTQVDAVRKESDEFFCEADRERVNELLLQRGA